MSKLYHEKSYFDIECKLYLARNICKVMKMLQKTIITKLLQ